jgi:outer membrane protein assembly factor BamB
VQAASARTLWRIKGESNDLAADGRRVFVASANRVNAYDAKTGKLAWTRAMATPSRPIRAGGLLYVRSRNTLMILAPTTGRTVASGTGYGALSDHVVAAGGRLYTLSGTTVRAYAP